MTKTKLIECALDPADLIDHQYIGHGKFGVIIRTKKQPQNVYKLLNVNACQDAKEETMIQQEIYQKFIDIQTQDLGMDNTHYTPPVILANIPKPICFGFLTKDTQYKHQNIEVDVHCLLAMEYIYPPNINNKNLHDGTLYSVHLAPISAKFAYLGDPDIDDQDFDSFAPDPKDGYFTGDRDNLKHIVQMIQAPVTISHLDIMATMGYLFAIIVFCALYNPQDIQFMLGIKNNIPSVVCFDFGFYLKITIFDDTTIDQLVNTIDRSPYLAWLQYIDCFDVFTQSIIDTVTRHAPQYIAIAKKLISILAKLPGNYALP